MGKSRLGRGLQALLPGIEEEPYTPAVDVATEDIELNPYQPRKSFDQERLEELARSVKQHGILQPLIVRPHGRQYELVAGERRLRAAKMAGLETVPVIIKSFSDREMMEIALIENLQRENLNPLEEAEAYKRLLEEFRYTQEQLAERVGKSRSAVANILRLLTLHADVKKELAAGNLSEGHARALLALPLEKQPEAARKVIELKLSVRETEKLAGQPQEKKRTAGKRRKTEKNLYLADLEDRLRQVWGTAVHIRTTAKGNGKIEIYFHDMGELERLCELLL
ncbi:MAG: ParB/RepB/Spo0J family partition protein [Firmicutes bacterium]|jgi:ParB family chromosome partitioning protein|nr:ParB/RepB/Spo0J family partition protein [Bacillota bacterium]